MSYKALYRKYRPKNFEEVVGQDYIIKTLKHAVEQNKIAHAYLFCGTRGTGKTSVAKIFAKSVNCLNENNVPCNKCINCLASDENNNTDIIEMDAASNNGVDEIREIIEKLKYAPVNGKYKVYIIDEVHMLSKGAFNALLKTLEEPPSYVIFILATTEPHKVLPTIISRCQRYDFLKVEKEAIIKRIDFIVKSENVAIDEEAKKLIAYLAEGGMRDALSILDQCIAYTNKKINADDINELYGLTSNEDKVNLINKIYEKQAKAILKILKSLYTRGTDFKRLTNELIDIFKEAVLYAYTKDIELLNNFEESEVKQILNNYSESDLLDMIDVLMKTAETYNNATNVYNYFEIACLKLMNLKNKEESVKKSKELIKENPEIIKDLQTEDFIISEIKTVSKTVSNSPQEKLTLSNNCYDDNFYIKLLVQCNKEEKKNDIEKFIKLKDLRFDIKCAKFVNVLNKTTVFASGKDCIILSSEIESMVNTINDTEINKEYYVFIKENLKIDKMIYSISENQLKNVLELFKSLNKDNTLPKPLDIQRYEIKIAEEPSDLDKVFAIFGKENVEVIKEED